MSEQFLGKSRSDLVAMIMELRREREAAETNCDHAARLAEVERERNEAERAYQRQSEAWGRERNGMAQANGELKARAERLAAALHWYADADNYHAYQDHDPGCHPEGGCVGTCGEHMSDVDRDGGERASAALADAPEPAPCPECERLKAGLVDMQHDLNEREAEADRPAETIEIEGDDGHSYPTALPVARKVIHAANLAHALVGYLDDNRPPPTMSGPDRPAKDGSDG